MVLTDNVPRGCVGQMDTDRTEKMTDRTRLTTMNFFPV